MFTITRMESIVVMATPAASETELVVMASNVTQLISGNKIICQPVHFFNAISHALYMNDLDSTKALWFRGRWKRDAVLTVGSHQSPSQVTIKYMTFGRRSFNLTVTIDELL